MCKSIEKRKKKREKVVWGKLQIIVMIALNATIFFCTVNLLKYDTDAILQLEFSKHNNNAICKQRIMERKFFNLIFSWLRNVEKKFLVVDDNVDDFYLFLWLFSHFNMVAVVIAFLEGHDTEESRSASVSRKMIIILKRRPML